MDIMQHQARKEGDAQRAKIRHLFPENNRIVPDPDITQPWTDAESMAALWKAEHNITSHLALLSRRLTSRVVSPLASSRLVSSHLFSSHSSHLTTLASPSGPVWSRLTPLVSSPACQVRDRESVWQEGRRWSRMGGSGRYDETRMGCTKPTPSYPRSPIRFTGLPHLRQLCLTIFVSPVLYVDLPLSFC